ncbi:chemotaxis protein CheA [Herbaspirillum frisingense]|uniref:histidine kinase n=1 Tax=Herbaspirillum frisingense TaxID=92645 RepID=A0ABU1PB60_9BURK|nr:Hpt domain-containing protein [Herbaspirillum frisingense]MDR6583141.1 chemosensory pili system protein ChpA (sensor histidine kinase/response regulator) [Herbaspirillum frisingense]
MHLDSASAAARSATEDSLDPVAGRIDASLRQTLLPLLTIVRQQDGVWRSCLGKGHAGAVPPLYRRTLLTLRDCARSIGAVPLADIASQLIMLLEQHTADSPLAPPRLLLLEQRLDQLTRLLDAPGTPAVLTLPGSEAPVPIIANVTTPHDVIDPGLLPVFLEEAQELMASIGETLLALPPGHSHTPADTDLLAELARPLHTLKGSARMVGAMRLSQCVHEMESALQCLQTGEAAQNAEVLTALLALYDQTMEHFSTLEQAAASVPAASRSGGLQSPLQPHFRAAPLLRIRTTVLDRLLNQVGEVSIMRARLDNEVAALQDDVRVLGDQLRTLADQVRQLQRHTGPGPGAAHELQAATHAMDTVLAQAWRQQKRLHDGVGRACEGLRQQGRYARELQQDLMHARMIKFNSMESRLQHLARQLAAETGKPLVLDLSDCRLQIDRAILERLMGPLEHLLRNCAVHGIEDTAACRAAGKPPSGQLRVQAGHEGNEAVIRVGDDGRGLDLVAIRGKARQRGLPAARDASDAGLAELIFEPGFSTSAQVSALAGRGIGMDVARAEVAALGGRMTVHSRPGQGVLFTLYLPLSLAVQQVCLLQHGRQQYAIPSTLIDSVLQLRSEQAHQALEQRVLEVNGRRLALYPLHHLLREQLEPEQDADLEVKAEAADQADTDSAFALLIKSGDELMVIMADHVNGNREVVVKPVGPQLATLAGLVGATVLGDGQIVLILNPLLLAGSRRADGSVVTPGVQ